MKTADASSSEDKLHSPSSAVPDENGKGRNQLAEHERVASFTEMSLTPVVEIDLFGHVHYLNTEARRLFPSLEIEGLCHSFLCGFPDIIADLQQGGDRIFRREVQVKSAYYEQVIHYLAHSSRVRIVALDITQLKQTQKALEAQSTFFRTVIDTAPYFIFAKDRQGRFTLVNKAVADAYGTTVEALTGKTDADFNANPEEVEHFRKDDLEVMDSLRERLIPEEVITDASGKKRWLQTFKLPIVDETGRATHVLGASTDITDRKQAEETRRRLEAQVLQAQKLESLGILAGGIAHDFNNLLMGVLGNASMLLMEIPEGTRHHKRLTKIRSAAERAAELTNQLLAYSGKGKFVVAPLDLSRTVTEMSELLVTAVSKKARVHYELCQEMPLIEADPTQIRQVIMNLIINASEALEEQTGDIYVKTGFLDLDLAYLSKTYLGDGLAEGRFAYIEVRDTGIGMDEQTRERMIDPLFTTKIAGRGLGLAGVIGIVRSHGGALKVDSAPFRGTSFRILLPCLSAGISLQTPASPRVETKEMAASGVFLLADDESIARSVARDMLEHCGFQVLTANDGVQALELFKRHADEIVAVLLDLTMPKMDGRETFSEMQRINNRIPVILSSGYSEQEALRLFKHEHFAEFLQKPYQFDSLVEKVRRVLSRAA